MIPKSIRNVLENQFDIKIESEQTVSGGSINRAHKLQTDQGALFLKWNRSAPDHFFDVEARGLKLLASVDADIRVPSVLVTQPPSPDTPGFLLIEYIREGSGSSSDSYNFGAELAKLHNTTGDHFGLAYDNFIGSLPQQNDQFDNWIPFFVEKRINPQLKMAIDSGKISQNFFGNWNRLSKKLEDLLPPTKPCLIHGDLWGGNYLFDENGTGILIDPAVYYGHPEMDLAFTKMFGGFSTSFYEGYKSVTPLEDDFSNRVPIYNLYPLLVHVNLFGGHYVSQFERIVGKY
ncbi:fructosamine kinase family protein [Rhodohalobacter sulfatireducens]|uniref:Fructosamine kinase family protein n=1 Tax=Rhodohalobacter sulfatireducens TaxID=2911366 RepID=A0ABS9KFG6_9BACT|nr:fructosamine kinase family protein [Rhodohalobacter sulfatireducens]MCG2589591.1 fructosamine kinase family protein [Rhodohalobacter sulfatireducens]